MFDISDYVTFNKNGRADCPVCTLDKGPRNMNLSRMENGYFQCFRGCSYREIQEVVGYKPDNQVSREVHQAKQKASAKIYSLAQIEAFAKALTVNDNPARRWLEDRGITLDQMTWARLGLCDYRVDRRRTKAICIPVPTGTEGEFYLKKRVAPWDEEIQALEKYVKWSQYGVPPTTLITYEPDDAPETWLCEGPWDAIRLGWTMKEAGESIAVACFSCGVNTVPNQSQLDKLPGTVKIFFDRNDKPTKRGLIPGDDGAKKVATALKGRGEIALVPMPNGCDVHGWDITDALNAGYSRSNFLEAAKQAKKYDAKPENPIEARGKWNHDLILNAPDYTEFLVPDLLTEDELFLLAAGPRAGKSLMAMTLAKAVAEGGTFLGRPVTQGRVYYAKCEDGDAKVKERELRQGWDSNLPVFWDDEFKLTEIDHLVDMVRRHDFRLVVLDTLARIKTPGVNESSAEMSQLLEPLQTMARNEGTCIVLVHHTTKISIENANSLDIFDTIRGSSAIRAVCRGAMVLAAGERDYRLVTENGWGKYDLRITLDALTLTWRELGKWGNESDMPQKALIVQALKKLGSATIKELQKETGIHPRSLYTQIDRLRISENAEERVIKEGVRRRYKYRLALFNTIQQLNCLSNRPNPDDGMDIGCYSTKSSLSNRDRSHYPLSHPIQQNPPGSPLDPKALPNTVEYPPENHMVTESGPIQQLVNTIQHPPNLSHRGEGEESQPCDSDRDIRTTTEATLENRTSVPMKSQIVIATGDKCKVLTGRFEGKLVIVLGFDKGGKAIVQADSWAITRAYDTSALKFISRPDESVSD